MTNRKELICSNYKTKNEISIFPSSVYANKLHKSNTHTELIAAFSSSSELNKSFKTVVFIDTEKIFKIPTQRKYLDQSGFVVYDAEGNTIMSNNLEQKELSGLRKAINYEYPEGIYTLNGSEYYIVRSEFEFVVLNKISNSTIITQLKSVNILIITLTVLASVIISFLSVFLFYRPIKNLLMFVGNKDRKEGNLFKILGSEIKNLKNQNSSLRDKISTLEDVDIRNVFQKAVNGVNVTSNDLSKLFSSITDDTSETKFYVLITAELIFEKDSENHDAQYGHISQKFQMFWQKELPKSLIFDLTSHRFTSLYLISNDISKLEGTLSRFISKFSALFSNVTLFLAVSDVHTNIADIKKAYDESLKCLDFKPVKSKNTAIYFDNIFIPRDYYLPFDELENLKNQFITGNDSKCMDIINGIITKNINLNLDLFTFKNLCYQLLRTIYQVIPRDTSESLNQSYNFISSANELYSLGNIDEFSPFFETLIVSLIKLIQRYSGGNSEFTSIEKINYIKDYIRLHYNEDLYLENLSAMVDLSPKYFSRFFKKVTGINVIEYLNKIRVRHAKEFLANQKLTISDVAAMTGYKSNSALTTNFNKYMGMQPSKYRAMVCKSNT